jgi:glycosyltransferase involved in cell wall biosynthesis
LSALDDVLVVTVRKSFWASPEARAWPRRLYPRVLYGHSTNLLNSLPVFVRALVSIWLRPPRLVLLGSVERTVPWFVRARRLGLLRGAKLVVTNQLHLSPAQLDQVDRVIVHARSQAEALGDKGAFLPLPADGDFAAARAVAREDGSVFTGGGADRDFAALVEAARGEETRLEIVAFAPGAVGGDLPSNVRVRGPLRPHEFLERMASAAVVAVAVREPRSPHGQTTLVQALALGKPVVATRSAGLVDYVEDGREGLLVEAGDVDGYRSAIRRLLDDPAFREACGRRAVERARQSSYDAFAAGLGALCEELLL